MPEYYLFYGGVFSQWYKSNFTLHGVNFTHAEQYMMWQKATLFNDADTAEKILRAAHPKEQKELGRQVIGYKDDVWIQERETVVYRGNYAKFTQNPEMLSRLLDVRGTFVEASPYDKIWGIGRGMDDPLALIESKWLGLNLLGKTLTRLRDDLLYSTK
jgi:ribA/ribD-fused uncharacterized protein